MRCAAAVGAIVVVASGACVPDLSGFSGGGAPDGGGGTAPGTVDGAAPDDATAAPGDATAAPDVGGDRYVAEVMTDAPTGWWRLEEASGTTAKDSSGQGHDAVIVGSGGVLFGVPGALASNTSRAFVLDGAASLALPDAFDLASPTGFTVEAWVRPAATDNAFRRIFSKIEIASVGPVSGSYLFFNGAIPRLSVEGWANEVLSHLVRFDSSLAETAFTHVVWVYDGSVSRVYVNGTGVGTSKSAPLTSTAEPPSWGKDWIGALDELAFYDKPLSSVRVLAHYRAAQP